MERKTIYTDGRIVESWEKEKITREDLDAVERYADKLFKSLDIDVNFTRHFMDRVNDERNRKQITKEELQRLFRESYRRYGKKIAKLGNKAEAVINDMRTDINMPFVIEWDEKNQEFDLIAKTIMRKKNFLTPNPKLAFESYGTDRERNTRELLYQIADDVCMKEPDGSYQCHECSFLILKNLDNYNSIGSWTSGLEYVKWDETKWKKVGEALAKNRKKFRSKVINDLVVGIIDGSVNGHSFIKFEGVYIDPYLHSLRVKNDEIDDFCLYMEKIYNSVGIKLKKYK